MAKQTPILTLANRRQRQVGLSLFVVVSGGLLALNILQRLDFNFGLLFWPCGFRVRTGYPCLTCGMTRSVLAFSRGDLIQAFRFQPAAGLLSVVVVILGGHGLFIALSGRIPVYVQRLLAEFRLKRFLLGLVLILLAGWAVTLAQAWIPIP